MNRSRVRGPAGGAPALALALALALATLAVYAQVRGFAYVALDDREYVVDNAALRPGFTPAGVAWALTTYRGGNWHPLTWLSHMLDYRLFGPGPAGPHLVNAALHAAAGALLLLLLWRLTGALWPSAFAAAVFALHPLRAESVAWVSERKDVLGALFWMLTTLAYERYARRRAPGWYLACAALFALGLTSKPTLVALPLTLLLLDVWPLGRLPGGPPGRAAAWRLAAEKAPLFALAAAAAALTLRAPIEHGDLDLAAQPPFGLLAANAVSSAVAYLGKLAWPARLAVVYPHPAAIATARTLAEVLVLGALTGAALAGRRRRPWLAAGWLWYLVVLVPVSGIVHLGPQAMADRYTYLPTIGVVVAVTWEAAARARAWPALRRPLAGVAVAVVAACAALGWRQVGFWRDGETLFRHAVEVTEGNYAAHALLAQALLDAGRPQEAEGHLRAALALNPQSPPVLTRMGLLLLERGEPAQAVPYFERVVLLEPGNADARRALEVAELRAGRPRAALERFAALRRRSPADAGAVADFALAVVAAGAAAEVLDGFRDLAAREPADAPLRLGLGIVLLGAGRTGEALEHVARAAALDPRSARVRFELGRALGLAGRPAEAEARLREALALEPGSVATLNELAALLAGRGNPAEAVALLERAAALAPADPVSHYNLGVARLGRADRDGAAASFRRALAVDPGHAPSREQLRRIEAQPAAGGGAGGGGR